MKLTNFVASLACFLGFIMWASGSQVDSKTAAAMTKGWLQSQPSPLGSKLGNKVKNVETFKDSSGSPLYHVVNLEPSGFVIASADDQAEPIIAFVEKGNFDPSLKNPLGALISRDMPLRMAKARAQSGKTIGQASHNKWQKLLKNAVGAVQPNAVSTGGGIGISDMRVAPFIQTCWDQGNLPITVTNLIRINNQIAIVTHILTDAPGDKATANVICPTNQSTVLFTPGNPVIHSYSGSGIINVDINNGPDGTVTNVITVNAAIHIVFTNEFGQIIANQVLAGTQTITNIVTGTPGSTVMNQIESTIELTMAVSDLKACYNYFTPPSEPRNTNNDVCGCVATAMAQLMYYFQSPITGVGTQCCIITVEGNPMGRNLLGGDTNGGPYDWADMPLTPDYFSLTQLQAQSVGALTRDAGYAVHMQYAAGGSSAYMTDAKAALVSTFKYSNAIVNSITNLDTGCFECNLFNMMNANLDARLPVLLGITGDPGGHAVVCDGYGYCFGAIYHHLNMGWSGSYNAWYALPIIDLDVDGTYTYFWSTTECIYNVFTNGSGEIISGRVLDNSGLPVTNACVTAVRAGGGTYQVTTDTNGIYALVGLPSASTYTLMLTNTGYFPVSQNYSTGTSSDASTTSGNVWGANFTIVPAQGPPVFALHPANQTVTTGSNACFDACVIGQLPLTFQWQYLAQGNSTWINVNDDGTHSGSLTTNLTINPVDLTMSGGMFQCVATNSLGRATSAPPVTLTVTGVLPVFTVQPQDQTVVNGSNGTFNAFATGTPLMHYQWQYQPSGSLTWVNETDDGTNSGSQTSILTINPTVLAMNGKPIHCVAANPWGCCTSTPATLTVSVNNSTPVYLGTLAGGALTSGNADGTNTNALFNHPCGIAVDNHTNIYVADMYNDVIRKVSLSGTNWVVATIAGLAGNSGSTDGTGTNSRFNAPYGIAVGADGNVYVSDTYNQTIRQLTPTGTNWVVSTIAGLVGTKGTNDGSNARFNLPMSLAADKTGYLYVADEGNSSIRKMTFNGAYWIVSSIAGGSFGSNDGTNRTTQFGTPYGITVNASGTVVSVADKYFSTVRQLTASGTNWLATTIAGKSSVSGSADGIGSTARFNNPTGIAVGMNGNLYVADCGNNTIRRLTPVGTNWNVFTIAGLAGSSGSMDGTGSNARLNGPFGIAVDNSTNLYVSDSINNTIRGTIVLSGASPLIVNIASQDIQTGKLAVSWNAVSGQTYQVQYKTNLNQAGWNNLTTVTTSNWTGNVTIPVGTDPQRFYRVISQ